MVVVRVNRRASSPILTSHQAEAAFALTKYGSLKGYKLPREPYGWWPNTAYPVMESLEKRRFATPLVQGKNTTSTPTPACRHYCEDHVLLHSELTRLSGLFRVLAGSVNPIEPRIGSAFPWTLAHNALIDARERDLYVRAQGTAMLQALTSTGTSEVSTTTQGLSPEASE